MLRLGLSVAALMLATPALADTITNLNSPTPAGSSWGTVPGENTGTVAITGTAPRSGNGSLEITGDRTRVQTGIQYSPYTTNITSLDNVLGLTYDWEVAADSSRQTYTPALRLLVQDGSTRSELIWEGAYQSSTLGSNGTAATNPTGTFYSSSSDDLFYRFVAGGAGPTYLPGTQTYVFNTIAGWANSTLYSDSAFVSGISVGGGSGATAGYHAFADNVTLTTKSGSTTYNFEVAGAVPEPATWAMMLVGFGMTGASLRYRRRNSKPVLA